MLNLGQIQHRVPEDALRGLPYAHMLSKGDGHPAAFGFNEFAQSLPVVIGRRSAEASFYFTFISTYNCFLLLQRLTLILQRF